MTIDYEGLPEHLRGAMQRYIEERVQPGGFLTAVLSNGLSEAVGRADATSTANLVTIVRWIYNEAPSGCWGSPERVDAWLDGARR